MLRKASEATRRRGDPEAFHPARRAADFPPLAGVGSCFRCLESMIENSFSSPLFK
jgi:hypothetical protein